MVIASASYFHKLDDIPKISYSTNKIEGEVRVTTIGIMTTLDHVLLPPTSMFKSPSKDNLHCVPLPRNEFLISKNKRPILVRVSKSIQTTNKRKKGYMIYVVR